MTPNLVPHTSIAPPAFDHDTVELIKRNVAKGSTDDELKIFLHQCQKTGLDPLAKQIYFRKQRTKSGDQMTIITGIDGYRLVADRTGKYAGNDDPIFDNEDNPRKATVTVYKIIAGVRCPYTASARWDQYYPGDSQGFMWRKMPHLMLGKCAEALALRKAFPAELSGVYVKEEMDQAGPILEGEIVPFESPKTSAPTTYDNGNPSHRAALIAYAKRIGVPGLEEAKKIMVRVHCAGIPLTNLEAAVKEAWEEMQQ